MTDATPPTSVPVADLAYADAVAELESILESLEGDVPDVDHLASSVARAAALIRECRARIAATRFEVERIVADLDAGTGSAAGDVGEDAGTA
jgi:exodeoxyribonuclease VII small subunit